MANQYTVDYPYTDQELHDLYWVEGLSQTKIAERFGLTQTAVGKHMKRAGIPNRGRCTGDQSGERNGNWRGGRVLVATTARTHGFTSGGYWYVYAPDHPNSKDGRYVAEHVKVATEKAGRPLAKGEHVHHVNLNKRDNRSENLAIGSSSQHAAWHAQLSALAGSLVDAGVLTFSPNEGYSLTEEVFANA